MERDYLKETLPPKKTKDKGQTMQWGEGQRCVGVVERDYLKEGDSETLLFCFLKQEEMEDKL